MPNADGPTRRAFLAGAATIAVSLTLVQSSLAVPSGDDDSSQAPQWLNPPRHWKKDGSSLLCTADPKTDFWRKTFYGYITDNGHLYYRRVRGDLTTQVKVSGQYHDLYDQAGLMVRIDAENWMKCGVEFVDGKQNMSIVYTRDFSNWATGRLPENSSALWVKVVRKGPALDIFHSVDGIHFVETGVGYLGTADSVMVGPMCAAPEIRRAIRRLNGTAQLVGRTAGTTVGKRQGPSA
jgi:regulation of enolase protein 1 (concanavalin A-like superfamily)